MDQVSKKVIFYVIEEAIRQYRDYGRKSSFQVAVEVKSWDYSFRVDYVDYFRHKAVFGTGGRRTSIKALNVACKTYGIKVTDYSEAGTLYFDVPCSYIESLLSEKPSEQVNTPGEFAYAIKNRRKDIVDRLVEITARRNDFVVLTKYGLYDSGDSDGGLSSLLLFSSLGLEPLDYNEKVYILAGAIVGQLNSIGKNKYFIQSDYRYAGDLYVYIRKRIENNEPSLNKW